MSLRARFFLVLAGLGLTILTAFALSLYLLGYRQVAASGLEARNQTLEKVASVCGEAAVDGSYISAINFLKVLAREPGIVHAGCLDGERRLRAHTNPVMIGETLPPGRAPAGRDGVAVEVYHALDRTFVELTRPVEPAGSAVVQYDEDLLRAQVRRRLLRLIYDIAAVSAAVLLTVVPGAALLLARALAAPISALEEASVEFGKGNFGYQSPVAGRPDEVGRLARRLADMAARLGELDRLKQRFLEHITHDLRQPLTAIQGYAEMIMEGMSGPVTDKQVAQLKAIQAGSQRLGGYIDDILDLAKLEAGRMSVKKAPVGLEAVLKSVEELMRASAVQYGVRLEVFCEPGLPPVAADAGLLNRAVTNLVGNALKFTPQDGLISLGARREGEGAARVTVSDTGPGIPKESLRKVFDKFFQVTETLGAARRSGTGLGLTITREIVEAHGGRIWVESEPGKGAAFHITLPLQG